MLDAPQEYYAIHDCCPAPADPAAGAGRQPGPAGGAVFRPSGPRWPSAGWRLAARLSARGQCRRARVGRWLCRRLLRCLAAPPDPREGADRAAGGQVAGRRGAGSQGGDVTGSNFKGTDLKDAAGALAGTAAGSLRAGPGRLRFRPGSSDPTQRRQRQGSLVGFGGGAALPRLGGRSRRGGGPRPHRQPPPAARRRGWRGYRIFTAPPAPPRAAGRGLERRRDPLAAGAGPLLLSLSDASHKPAFHRPGALAGRAVALPWRRTGQLSRGVGPCGG